jgi:hypothetical protein
MASEEGILIGELANIATIGISAILGAFLALYLSGKFNDWQMAILVSLLLFGTFVLNVVIKIKLLRKENE